MLETLGILAAAGMVPVAAEPASIRINLVAQVPVVCSTASVLLADATATGLRATLTGSCNADHVVRVTLRDGSNPREAQLDGDFGLRDQGAFLFRRAAYFAPVSTLELDFGAVPPVASDPASQIVVEISPV